MVVALAWSLFLGPYGFSDLHDLRQTVIDHSGKVQNRIEANQDLERRLDALQKDPRALDSELRSSQNWVRPGEVMIVLPSEREETRPR